MPNTQYVKHNKVCFKSVQDKHKGTKLFIDFFNSIEEEEIEAENGMMGHMILEGMGNTEEESIVLTFWESRVAMDNFYSPSNKTLNALVERAKPLFKDMPKRSDYILSESSMTTTKT